jgi:hypothetical protein
MIAAIQSGTRDAVASMTLGVSRVTEGVALATQAGEVDQRDRRQCGAGGGQGRRHLAGAA